MNSQLVSFLYEIAPLSQMYQKITPRSQFRHIIDQNHFIKLIEFVVQKDFNQLCQYKNKQVQKWFLFHNQVAPLTTQDQSRK
ncbi:unnamed protein product [Paramecium octaurelia]|uniref:Uncharacterized protein n=1 Tax=Paramecium octaurelia TaxID=43137 RepID=A0A8S1YN95_PAROT|nr:unnamed protein product [Paramecium octaurelia]